jgi:hypothetical protein
MGSRAEFRHGTKVALFTRGKAIKADSEEAFVEVSQDRAFRSFDVPLEIGDLSAVFQAS